MDVSLLILRSEAVRARSPPGHLQSWRALLGWRKSALESQHRSSEWFEVVLDGPRHVSVVRVEVPVGQSITHAGDVGPGVARLGVEKLGGDRLDGLADLDEPDPDSIEDEAVGERTAGHVAPAGVDGIKDVL